MFTFSRWYLKELSERKNSKTFRTAKRIFANLVKSIIFGLSKNKILFMAKMKATFESLIEKALDGRTQTSIIEKMRDKGVYISDSQFSRKKKGREKFNEKELSVLSEILNVEL